MSSTHSSRSSRRPALQWITGAPNAVRLFLLAAVIAIAASPRVALAHAHLVRSAPAANSHLAVAPALIQLWFSEAAEPAMATIAVAAENGERVQIGTVKAAAADPLLLEAAFTGRLAAGRYTVTWRVVAKDDGHPSAGKFSFVVDGSAVQETPLSTVGPTVTAASTTLSEAAPSAAAGPIPVDAMDVEAPSYVLARWLNFLALIAVTGVAAFRFLVLPRVASARDAGKDGADERLPDMDSFVNRSAGRAASLGVVASATVLIAAVWRLYAERAVVGGGVSIGAILHSQWGRVWHVQLAAALIAGIAFVLARRSDGTGRRQPAWIVAGLAVVILGATSAFSGHAMAAPKYRTVSVVLDILHVLAAGGWLGGLFVLTVAGVPTALSAGNEADAPGRISLVARLVNAFSPVALALASIVIVSGVIAARLRLGAVAALFHSDYGTVLMVKLGLVMLVLAGGAFNWLRMRAALSSPAGGSAMGRFRRAAWFELGAGVLVIAATAVLVASQPPVH